LIFDKNLLLLEAIIGSPRLYVNENQPQNMEPRVDECDPDVPMFSSSGTDMNFQNLGMKLTAAGSLIKYCG
jgi:hypothetical protein